MRRLHAHRFRFGQMEQVPIERSPSLLADSSAATVTDDESGIVVTVRKCVERHSRPAGHGDWLTVVAVEGEIDQDTAPLVRLALSQALDGRAAVCCDLSRVTFLGAAGAGMLLSAHARAVASGRVFFLRGAWGITARVLDVVDPEGIVER